MGGQLSALRRLPASTLSVHHQQSVSRDFRAVRSDADVWMDAQWAPDAAALEPLPRNRYRVLRFSHDVPSPQPSRPVSRQASRQPPRQPVRQRDARKDANIPASPSAPDNSAQGGVQEDTRGSILGSRSPGGSARGSILGSSAAGRPSNGAPSPETLELPLPMVSCGQDGELPAAVASAIKAMGGVDEVWRRGFAFVGLHPSTVELAVEFAREEAARTYEVLCDGHRARSNLEWLNGEAQWLAAVNDER